MPQTKQPYKFRFVAAMQTFQPLGRIGYVTAQEEP